MEQTITLTAGSRAIDFHTEIESVERGSGCYVSSFPCSDTPEFLVDVPFGIEERDLSRELFGPINDNPGDNIERRWTGLFYADTFCSYRLSGARCSVVGTDTGPYFLHERETGTVSLILTRVLDVEHQTDWFANADSWYQCIGVHSFSYSLLVHRGFGTTRRRRAPRAQGV